jgi:hypothetical protein
MDNIQIIRLRDGEDIIANIAKSDHSVFHLTNPMSLFHKRMSEGRMVVFMTPWLPIEIIEINEAKIFCNEVLTLIEPKKSMTEYYTKAVAEMNENLEHLEENITAYDEMEEDEEPSEQLPVIEDVKDKVIH